MGRITNAVFCSFTNVPRRSPGRGVCLRPSPLRILAALGVLLSGALPACAAPQLWLTPANGWLGRTTRAFVHLRSDTPLPARPRVRISTNVPGVPDRTVLLLEPGAEDESQPYRPSQTFARALPPWVAPPQSHGTVTLTLLDADAAAVPPITAALDWEPPVVHPLADTLAAASQPVSASDLDPERLRFAVQDPAGGSGVGPVAGCLEDAQTYEQRPDSWPREGNVLFQESAPGIYEPTEVPAVQPPGPAGWATEYVLRVLARDRAGNLSDEAVVRLHLTPAHAPAPLAVRLDPARPVYGAGVALRLEARSPTALATVPVVDVTWPDGVTDEPRRLEVVQPGREFRLALSVPGDRPLQGRATFLVSAPGARAQPAALEAAIDTRAPRLRLIAPASGPAASGRPTADVILRDGEMDLVGLAVSADKPLAGVWIGRGVGDRAVALQPQGAIWRAAGRAVPPSDGLPVLWAEDAAGNASTPIPLRLVQAAGRRFVVQLHLPPGREVVDGRIWVGPGDPVGLEVRTADGKDLPGGVRVVVSAGKGTGQAAARLRRVASGVYRTDPPLEPALWGAAGRVTLHVLADGAPEGQDPVIGVAPDPPRLEWDNSATALQDSVGMLDLRGLALRVRGGPFASLHLETREGRTLCQMAPAGENVYRPAVASVRAPGRVSALIARGVSAAGRAAQSAPLDVLPVAPRRPKLVIQVVDAGDAATPPGADQDAPAVVASPRFHVRVFLLAPDGGPDPQQARCQLDLHAFPSNARGPAMLSQIGLPAAPPQLPGAKGGGPQPGWERTFDLSASSVNEWTLVANAYVPANNGRGADLGMATRLVRIDRPGLAPQPPTAAGEGDHWAILLGIQRYDNQHWMSLQGAGNDAQAVARLLRDHGYAPDHMLLITDRDTPGPDGKSPTTAEAISPRFNQFIRRFAADSDAAKTLFFFFSGHGVTLNRQSYLIPSDGLGADDLTQNWISMDGTVLPKIKQAMPGSLVIAIDACQESVDDSGRKVSSSFRSFGIPTSLPAFVFYSCRDGENSYENNVARGHGDFAALFCKALESHATGTLRARGLEADLQACIGRDGGGLRPDQHPTIVRTGDVGSDPLIWSVPPAGVPVAAQAGAGRRRAQSAGAGARAAGG